MKQSGEDVKGELPGDEGRNGKLKFERFDAIDLEEF